MADIAKLVEELSKLTVLEAADLAKALEEAWGVSAAAAVAVAAATAAAAPKGSSVAVVESTPLLPRSRSAENRMPLPTGPTAMRLPLSCDNRSNGSSEE